VRTPPIPQATYSPPTPPSLLSAGLQVAVGATTDPHYHPLVLLPHHQPALPSGASYLLCLHCGALPAATDLVVLLRSYLHLQPCHLTFLLSTRLQVGCCRCC
jgi:hypothetical protein